VSGGNFLEGQFTAEAIDILVQTQAFLALVIVRMELLSMALFFYFLEQKQMHFLYMKVFGPSILDAMEWIYHNYRAYQAGGYSFNAYAFLAQKEDGIPSNINQMGIFVHEFSHVLGLSDLYGSDQMEILFPGHTLGCDDARDVQ
jgi:hypothetical protein